MSTEYKIRIKFGNDDNTASRTISISNARSDVTKEQVMNFSTALNGYTTFYSDVTKVTAADLIQTVTTDLLTD